MRTDGKKSKPNADPALVQMHVHMTLMATDDNMTQIAAILKSLPVQELYLGRKREITLIAKT